MVLGRATGKMPTAKRSLLWSSAGAPSSVVAEELRYVTITLPVEGGQRFSWTVDGKRMHFHMRCLSRQGTLAAN